jgi:hypothetical protein
MAGWKSTCEGCKIGLYAFQEHGFGTLEFEFGKEPYLGCSGTTLGLMPVRWVKPLE